MEFYDLLDTLGQSVAHYGTDSVETGCMLGESSDELGKDDHINYWISAGQKTYAYDTAKSQGNCKIKGSHWTGEMLRTEYEDHEESICKAVTCKACQELLQRIQIILFLTRTIRSSRIMVLLKIKWKVWLTHEVFLKYGGNSSMGRRL